MLHTKFRGNGPAGSGEGFLPYMVNERFFSILFLYFPPTQPSAVLEFNYVFSFCLFYCSQVDLSKIKFIRTIFQLN